MYEAYEFSFAEESASMYGMMIYDIGGKSHSDNPFGNDANIVETRLPRRITPLHYGVRYHDEPLQFTLIFGSERYMDRYELQEISQWLTGYQEYQWLSIDQPDMEHIQFHCLIQSLTPISVGWLPVAFEAKVVCDCPYGYSYPFEKVFSVSGTTKARFYNPSTVRELLLPDVKIEVASGCSSFSIQNQSAGVTSAFSGLPTGGVTIFMDNENGILRDGSNTLNYYQYFNFQFFALQSGDNALEFAGNGTVTVSGRYLYNVGA